MMRIGRSLTVALALVAGTLAAVAATPPGAALATGPQWFDGLFQESTIIDCTSIIFPPSFEEFGAASFVGFYAQPEASTPSVNSVYYVHVVVEAIGNACSGQHADINLALPANTSLAISATNPVKCFEDTTAITGPDCPQSLPSSAGIYGAGYFRVPTTDSAHADTWPLPIGHAVEIQIPVTSSTTLSGSTLQGAVKIFDGNDSPVLRPSEGVYVFSAGTPAVLADPTDGTHFDAATWPTTMKSWTYVYPTAGTSGNVYFDLMKTSGGTVVFTDGPAVIPASATGFAVWDDWTPYAPGSLQANTTYYWRARYVTNGTTLTYTGPIQSFTTPPGNTSTVGSGAAGTCTGAALATALAAANAIINFSCGTAPVSITMTAAASIASNDVIDGKGLVTLHAAANSRLFNVTAGSPTIKNVTLVGGNSAACGGAIAVQNTATVTLANVRITGNATANFGAGVCVNAGGTANISDSSVNTNTSAFAGGGIYNAGTLSLTRTDVSANISGAPGGGIYNGGSATISASSILGNQAGPGSAGGGIVNGGTGIIDTSTIAGNTAGSSGGGISNSSTSLQISNSTIAGNTAVTAGGGGGLFSTTASTLRNTILSGNTAAGAAGNCATTPSQRVFTSQGHNLDSGATCALAGVGDITNTDPQLLALAANGGPTKTFALSATSPAIDKGDNSTCGVADQRGVSNPVTNTRAVDGDAVPGAVCDIGAVERAAYAPSLLPIVPGRIMETRSAPGLTTVDHVAEGIGQLAAGSTYQLQVSGRGGVPADASAVVLNVTVTQPVADGYVTVFPCGAAQPLVSNLNYTAGQTIPNAVVVKVGDAGKVCIFTSQPTHLIADVNGYFPFASTFSAIVPGRILETRAAPGLTTVDHLAEGIGQLAAGSTYQLQVGGRAGVPSDAAAVVLNVTLTQPAGPGYVTVYPCGAAQPLVSNLNYSAGQTIPNAVIVKVGDAGKVCIFTSESTHLIADVNGYFPAN